MTDKRKAYWLANVTITDPDMYAGYQAVAPEAFAKHNARFLARGSATTLEGNPWERRVIIEFASMEDAQACYHSPEYQNARKHRISACRADIALIEGLE
ncbi:MAG: DUF1330 domain-containing protein [Pseudomonadota bacterium]